MWRRGRRRLQLPAVPEARNASVLRDAVAKGIAESAFGYTALAVVEGDALHIEPTRVWIGKATTADEIDLGSDAFLLSAAFARSSVGEPEPPKPPQAPESPEPPKPPKIDAEGGRSLTVGFTVGKQGVFAALQMLPTLADVSASLELSVSIKAEAQTRFEKTWVRNVVQEPLDEADVTDQIIELGD